LSAVESTSSRRSILQLPATLKRRLGMGYLFVTNDLNVVRLLCDRSVIAVSLQGAQATKQSRPIECSAARDCFAALTRNKMVQGCDTVKSLPRRKSV
jgi:ABC-type microcin C transport system duplicated ATPase subunit YejF